MKIFRLYLVLNKFEGKYERKKIERKNRMKEKIKENKKIYLNLINYFYMFLKFILLISLIFKKIK